MPYRLEEKICQVCHGKYMGEPKRKTCSRSCATKGVNSRRKYKRGENHHNFKHGSIHGHKKEYMAWRNMIDRCLRDTNKNYGDYGGRGIKVFVPWVSNFNLFFEYMGVAPSPKHSVGRFDNDGNYEPGNVGWQTKKEQMANRRNNRWIEYDGKKMIMADWAKSFGIESTNLLKMIKKYSFTDIHYYYQNRTPSNNPESVLNYMNKNESTSKKYN